MGNQLTEGMQNEFETQAGADMLHQDDMLQALQNFTEMHANLLANREDQMLSQMREWQTSFFDRNRELQYKRNRGRIEEITQIIETAKEEIRTLEGNDMDEAREDVADQ